VAITDIAAAPDVTSNAARSDRAGGGRVLDAPNHQGKFGQDYIRALASAAGLLVFTYDLDRVGIDLGFRFPGRPGGLASPAIEVQVKTCSKPTMSGDELLYDGLTEQQFNWLAGPDYTVPRYLFLLPVPNDSKEYARFEPGGMTLQHLAYYLSLETEPPVADPSPTRRRKVRVPVGNVLTIRSLLRLFEPIPVGPV
jgi:hypothetical protein